MTLRIASVFLLVPAAAPFAERASDPAEPVTALAFAPGGGTLIAAFSSRLEEFVWPTLAASHPVETKLARVDDARFSTRAAIVAFSGGVPGVRGEVEVHRWPGRSLLWSSAPHRDLIYAVAWSSDDRRIVCASHDGTATVLDAADGRTISMFAGHSRPLAAVCALDGAGLAVTAGVDASLRVWDVETGKPLRAFDNHTGPVRALSAVRAPGGQEPWMLASAGDDGTVRLWQPEVGRLLRFVRLESPPLAIEWSSDGRSVVAASRDGRVRVIDAASVEGAPAIAAVDGWAHALALHPSDGSAAVGGERGQVVRVVLPTREKGHP